MTDFNDLVTVHHELTQLFEGTLAGMSADVIHANVDNGWTICQILKHVVLVERSIFPFITSGKHHNPVVNRGPAWLLKALLNREYKVDSPRPFVPGEDGNWTDLNSEWAVMRNSLEERLVSRTLLFDAAEIEHPFLGKLTRLDWFYVYYFHTERHRLQMEDLLSNGALRS